MSELLARVGARTDAGWWWQGTGTMDRSEPGEGVGAGSAEPLAGAALGLHYVWKQGNTTLPDRWYPFTFPAKSHSF